MPRVFRLINRFNLGGPTYNVAYLSRYLAPEFETLLAGGEKDESEGSSEYMVRQLGLEPIIIPRMRRPINFRDDRAAYQHIKKLIKEFKPDIVHTHASKAGTLGRLAAASCKVPVVVHTFHGHVFHSYFGRTQTEVYKRIERYLARRSTAIVAISDKQKEELALEHRICPPEKITVVPLGFDLSRFDDAGGLMRAAFRNEWKLRSDEVAIVILGRLVPVKNHELFLNALKQVMNLRKQPVRAFIVGDGELRSTLEQLTRQMGFSIATSPHDAPADVTFTSWIRDAERVLAGADVVCLSSWNEGTPVSLIEAQAAGKPVVSTRVGGVENVVDENRTGFLSPTGDSETFAAHLLRLVNDTGLRHEMGSHGKPHVMERYHYTRLVNDMAALYRRLLDNA
ncbi:MAG: glycosyltransferase [Bacteroidia bacterium]|nr:glycosyltransferase [Bacteroidia bacterium]